MRDVDPEVQSLAAAQGGLIRVEQFLALGRGRDGLDGDARAGRSVRLFRGVHAITGAAPPDETLRLLAAHLHLGADSVAVLNSAAHLHGIQGVRRNDVPHLAVPPGQEKRQRRGVAVHFWDIPEGDVTRADNVPATVVRRTLADLIRYLPRMQAVACVDSSLFQGLITEDDLPVISEMIRRKRGCVPGRRWLAQSRLGAQSPLETRVRLRADDAGLPPDLLQVPIRDRSGLLLGYGDMGYRLPDGTWLIVEADGRSVHELPEALLRDRQRQNAFLSRADAGIMRFTWEDTTNPAVIPAALGPVLRRAGWSPSPRRP